MAGHPLKKIQCESIARHSGKRCRAKGYLKKSGHYRCRFHGGASTGARTFEGKVRALRNLKQFKNFEEKELREWITSKQKKSSSVWSWENP